jgi:pimeloyl-ACP methyl ester carboxylesterase
MLRAFAITFAALSLAAAQTPVRQAELRYASSIDPIPNLIAHIAWPADGRQLPVLVVMHGFRMQANSFKPDTYARLAANAFVIGVEMRGRGGAGGTPDAGGREVYDILDAVRTVLQRYPRETDPKQIHIVGYSGGGADAMACAARFPDTFNTVTSFFGIADYAEWFGQAAPDQRRALAEWAKGTPKELEEAYKSRSPLFAITNYTGGYLRLYHDHADTNVPAVHSEQVAAVMKSAGLNNFAIHISESADAVRWIHQAPNDKSPDIQAEKEWLPDVTGKRRAPWTVPLAGTLHLAGYLETKVFTFWLGDGTEEAADLRYDIVNHVFNTKAASPWRLILKRQTPSSRVTVSVNGVSYDAVASADGNAIYMGRPPGNQ